MSSSVRRDSMHPIRLDRPELMLQPTRTDRPELTLKPVRTDRPELKPGMLINAPQTFHKKDLVNVSGGWGRDLKLSFAAPNWSSAATYTVTMDKKGGLTVSGLDADTQQKFSRPADVKELKSLKTVIAGQPNLAGMMKAIDVLLAR